MTLRIERGGERRAAEEYRLVGVHCVSCKRVIEEELSRVPGVLEARVDPDTGLLHVVLEEGVDRERLVEAVRRAGYDVAVSKLLLYTPGSEEEAVAVLERIPGVLSAGAVGGGDYVRVEYNPLVVSGDELIEELRGAGVRVEAAEGTMARGVPRWPLGLAAAGLLAYTVGLLAGLVIVEALGALLALAAAWPSFLRPALRAARLGRATMDTLLSLGVASAVAASLLSLARGGPAYFDAVVLITFFILAGRSLEAWLRERARRSLGSLADALPGEARLIDGRRVTAGEVEPGERVVVEEGERVPVDGWVDDGQGYLDESLVTGEPSPRWVEPGGLVIAGSRLLRGRLVVRATRTGDHRLLARALESALEASTAKRGPALLADRLARVFVPLVLLVAAASGLAWLAYTGDPATALLVAATVLVVSCPCTFGIAVPSVVSASTAVARRLGAIVSRPGAVEDLAGVGVVAFDKTGTLTRARPRVAWAAERVPGALCLAASLEAASRHPLAKAIVEYALAEGCTLETPQEVEEVPGYGVLGRVSGRSVIVGGERMMQEAGIPVEPEGPPGTRVYVAVDGAHAATLVLRDPPRRESREAVERLKSMGLRVVIVSGDSKEGVEPLARELGITEYYYGLDPLAKKERVARLQAEAPVAYVGDGANDAAAMGEARVGIAVPGGHDIARASADIVLARDDPRIVADLLELSRRAMARVKLSLAWALAYNAALIPVAAGALAWAGVRLEPGMAALAMSLSSVSLTLNAASLYWYRPRRRSGGEEEVEEQG